MHDATLMEEMQSRAHLDESGKGTYTKVILSDQVPVENHSGLARDSFGTHM